MPAKSKTKSKSKTTKIEAELAKNVKDLTKQLTRLKKQDFFKYFTDTKRFLLFSFLQGLLRGFGAIIGATILVGIVIYILSQITFIPLIGDFISDVLEQIQSSTPTKNFYK